MIKLEKTEKRSKFLNPLNFQEDTDPLGEHLEDFDVNLRMMSRPGVQASSFTDAWALPYLLWDGEAVEEPERFTERLRTFLFGARG